MLEIKAINGLVLYIATDATNVRSALEDAVKNGANLARANLEGEFLKGAFLGRANLEGAYLRGAFLEGAYLREANLRGAFLERANLEEAYLRGAFLGRANLEETNLERANLARANLEGANLRGAFLEGAYLREAFLEGASLGRATWIAVADTLRAAVSAMNDNGRHWIQGELKHLLDDGSIAYCSIGSIENEGKRTAQSLALWLVSSVCVGDIAEFNDDPATSWEDIKAVFSIAIRHAERFAKK